MAHSAARMQSALRGGLVGAGLFATVFCLILFGDNRDEEWFLALLSIPTSIALGPILYWLGIESLRVQQLSLFVAGCLNWFVIAFVLTFVYSTLTGRADD